MADTAVVTYPFDPTGTAATNKVVDEIHVVTDVNDAPYRILIPNFAPFYLNNLTLVHVSQTGVETPMNKKVDYDETLPYHAASRSIGQYLYGGLEIFNKFTDGVIKVTYQTIGDKWCADSKYVYNLLLEKIYNQRTVFWDHITNVQDLFPPIPHDENINLFMGHEELLKALAVVAKAIAEKQIDVPALFLQHINDQNNPHNISAATVNLENVANYPIATDVEVINRQPLDKYVTLRQLVNLLIPS